MQFNTSSHTVCSCLPAWMSIQAQKDERHDHDTCSLCHKTFPKGTKVAIFSAVITCACVRDRVHTTQFWLHKECAEPFLAQLPEKDVPYELYPIRFDQTPADVLLKVQRHCLHTHPQPVRRCIMCMAKTDQVCSGCKKVSYCSKSCQKAHWHDHKQFCQKLRFTSPGAPWEDGRCVCYDESQQQVNAKINRKKCCAETCEKDGLKEHTMTMLIDCRFVNLRSHPIHLMKATYCSNECMMLE